jgi:hypothetical protein
VINADDAGVLDESTCQLVLIARNAEMVLIPSSITRRQDGGANYRVGGYRLRFREVTMLASAEKVNKRKHATSVRMGFRQVLP